MEGRGNKKLTIITAYCVNDNNIGSAGPSTSFTQQWTALRLAGDENPQVRKGFYKDLSAFITRRKNEDHWFVIMIDANGNPHDPQSELPKFMQDHALGDAHAYCHPTIEPPATHNRGSKQIDFMLVSVSILKFVTAAGLLAFGDTTMSDH